MPVDAAAYLARGNDLPLPPLLMISGERDLDYVCTFVPEVERQFRAALASRNPPPTGAKRKLDRRSVCAMARRRSVSRCRRRYSPAPAR
jgi:hypothetical protein